MNISPAAEPDGRPLYRHPRSRCRRLSALMRPSLPVRQGSAARAKRERRSCGWRGSTTCRAPRAFAASSFVPETKPPSETHRAGQAIERHDAVADNRIRLAQPAIRRPPAARTGPQHVSVSDGDVSCAERAIDVAEQGEVIAIEHGQLCLQRRLPSPSRWRPAPLGHSQ